MAFNLSWAPTALPGPNRQRSQSDCNVLRRACPSFSLHSHGLKCGTGPGQHLDRWIQAKLTMLQGDSGSPNRFHQEDDWDTTPSSSKGAGKSPGSS